MKTWTTKSGHKITRLLAGRSNVFLLSSLNRHLLIDTSIGLTWPVLKKRLLKTLPANSRLVALIITHTHFDHCANATKIAAESGRKIIVHRLEAENLQQGTNSDVCGSLFLTRIIITPFRKLLKNLLKYPPALPDTLAEDKYDLSGYGFNAYILHTPGHTVGSVSVIVDNEIAIVGDAMFGVFPNSIYPPYALDSKQMIRSWKKLLDTGCRIFIPAHGHENKRKLVEKEYDKHSRD